MDAVRPCREHAAARAQASSARSCGRSGRRARSRRRRCPSWAATGRRSRGPPRARDDRRARSSTAKPPSARRDVEDAVIGQHLAPSASAREQRVEHVTRAIAVGKELAAGFLVQRHAELAEKRDRLGNGNAAGCADDGGRPPLKSASVTTVLVTLQRDPPLTRIFAPGRRAPSRTATPRRPAAAEVRGWLSRVLRRRRRRWPRRPRGGKVVTAVSVSECAIGRDIVRATK